MHHTMNLTLSDIVHFSFDSSVPHRTIKLFLIGNGERGKTTLLRRLRGLPEEKSIDRTEGIDIEDWHYAPSPGKLKFSTSKPQVHFLAWDFAGQVNWQFFATVHVYACTVCSVCLIITQVYIAISLPAM